MTRVPGLVAGALLVAFLPALALATPARIADLRIREPGFQGSLRIELLHLPRYLAVPAAAGDLLLIRVSEGEGPHAFFIPSDLAFEMGERVYRVDQERASDLLGQTLGGRLRPGEVQLGFVLVPGELGLAGKLAADPESVIVRYAHHRVGFRVASEEEAASITAAMPRPAVGAGLNFWWEWIQAVSRAPAMTEGEERFLAERLAPGQGHLLARESIRVATLRNAILRVGERRLLQGPARKRVQPPYPAAARQLGVEGLVIVLAYVTERGTVGDAAVLVSSTAHLLNLAALATIMDWEFVTPRDEAGQPTDGWRLVPVEFRIPGGGREREVAAPSESDSAGYHPPRVVRRVEPVYPERARQKRIEGTVVYRAVIGPEGRLEEAILEQGAHPLLDEAALRALERSLFVPATRGGTPVRGEIEVSYSFGKAKS